MLLRQGVLVALLAAGCQRQTPGALGRIGVNLIKVSAGTYRIGVAGNSRNPAREVSLGAFRIADAETTNAEFTRFIEATGYVTDAERAGFGQVSREGMPDWAWSEVPGANWRHPHGPDGISAAALPNHPVTQISGADAEAYCRWAGGRLPTLAEWEVAARAGAATRWPWGNAFEVARANVWNGEDHQRNTAEDGWKLTSPVRSFPPNAWGLYDVIGNVFEYCADLPPNVPAGLGATLIAGRGGSWWCSAGTCSFYNLEDVGVMARHGSLSNQGFRIVYSQ